MTLFAFIACLAMPETPAVLVPVGFLAVIETTIRPKRNPIYKEAAK